MSLRTHDVNWDAVDSSSDPNLRAAIVLFRSISQLPGIVENILIIKLHRPLSAKARVFIMVGKFPENLVSKCETGAGEH